MTQPIGEATVLEESDAPTRQLARGWRHAISLVAIVCTAFHVVVLAAVSLDPWLFLGLSLGCFWVLGFMLFPATRAPAIAAPIDVVLVLASIGAMTYLVLEYQSMYDRVGFRPETWDWIWGSIAVLLTLEMTRRVLGWTFPIMCVVCIAYALWGGGLPGFWGHRGYEYDRVMSTMYSTEGLYGSAMAAASTYIVLFVAFSAFLRATGVGPVFIRLATALAGRARGGPAKVAVVASALFGTVSGSSMGNVAAVGTFTIPLMKRTGYSPTFAAAVEAAASTGGQIMPPVMGAVAFVLAEATNMPYRDVMFAAIIPAICYFATIYFVIDFEALKLGLAGTPKEELPTVGQVLRDGWLLFVPLVALIAMIVFGGRSVIQSALICIVLCLLVDLIRRRRPMRLADFLSALREGSVGSVEAVAACACAGIMIGVFALTGVGNRFVELVLAYGQGQVVIALVIVMLVTILLGFPLPTVAAYVITAAVGAPVLVKLGVPLLAAHMFIMYYACVSTVTPPIALAAFTAAGIAGADPDRTGWLATRLTVAAYVVPFVLIYNPAVMWQGDWTAILRALVMCLIAGYALAGATNSNFGALARVTLFACSIAVFAPSLAVNLAGLTVLIATIAAVTMLRRRGARLP